MNHILILFIIALFLNNQLIEGVPSLNSSTLLIKPEASTFNGSQFGPPNSMVNDHCVPFTYGVSDTEFTSPLFPEPYPPRQDCVRQITAPEEGQIVRIQFRDVFEMEEQEDGICKYDYLEVRDGEHAYSTMKVRLCGSRAPFPYLTSTGRHMWLRFHSDDTIGYTGFRAFISYAPAIVQPQELGYCSSRFVKEPQGHINTTMIPEEVWQMALAFNKHVDCTWIVEAELGKKVFLQFDSMNLDLQAPNNCEYNFIQVYKSQKEFSGQGIEPDKICGSIIVNVKSIDHTLAVRFRSRSTTDFKKRSKMFANFTIQRDSDIVTSGSEKPCRDDEFDCKDGFCIDIKQRCNGIINCDRPIDEEKCADPTQQLTADILVIAFIGCLLIAGMCGGLVMNIFRKLRQDRADLMELRESIQKSRESMAERQSATTSQSAKSLDQSKILAFSSPPVSSHESGDTVIEKPSRGQGNEIQQFVQKPDKWEKPSSLSNDLQLVLVQKQPPEKTPRFNESQLVQKPAVKINGDLRLVRPAMADAETNPITYSPPPSYPHSAPALKSAKKPENDPPGELLCVEVRDCACQTRESLLAKRRAPLARGEAVFYDLTTSTPVRRVARMLPRSSGADIVAIYPFYAASSASSETGRSLERLDEYQE